MNNYVYRRKRLQVTRSPFRRLADGEPFFYAMLLERGCWRSEEEIKGAHQSFKNRFLSLYPEEYRHIIMQQKLGRHQCQLSFAATYDEIVHAVVESIDRDVQDIVDLQLKNLRPTRKIENAHTDSESYDATLHMGDDQYEVYSVVMNSVNQRRSIGCQRLFFVTGSAGTGKSYVLSAIQRSLNERRIKFIKIAPTGIAAINIQGQTIHSALAITTTNNDGKSTSFMTSMHQSEQKSVDLRSVEVILIDEVSMVSTELLNFMSAQFAKLHSNGRPFGGRIVITFGDLLQLPPVTGQPIYRSNIWTLFFPLFLKFSHRQSEDSTFVKILNEIRIGNISDRTWEILEGLERSFTARSSRRRPRVAETVRTAGLRNTSPLPGTCPLFLGLRARPRAG